jgi:hypothetical protein
MMNRTSAAVTIEPHMCSNPGDIEASFLIFTLDGKF